MSSFFQSPLDVSSSTEETNALNDAASQSREVHGSSVEKKRDHEHYGGHLRGPRSSSDHNTGHHTNILLHSLLEDKCFAIALEHFRETHAHGHEYSADDPDVRQYAQTKYEQMSEHLSSMGIIPQGYHHQSFSELRNKYRQGIELMSRSHDLGPQLATTKYQVEGTPSTSDISAALEPEPGTSMTSKKHGPSDSNFSSAKDLIKQSDIFKDTALGEDPLRRYQMSSRRHPNLPHRPADHSLSKFFLPEIPSFLVRHDLIQTSRYQRDFTELGLLGRGGYGTVFKAQHKLDQSHYAVKQVSLSPSRISKIREKGAVELDCILTELRILARLDHPNIVRYFNGWLEFSNSGSDHSHSSDFDRNRKLLDGSNNSIWEGESSGWQQKLTRVETESSSKYTDPGIRVVFENSNANDPVKAKSETIATHSSGRSRGWQSSQGSGPTSKRLLKEDSTTASGDEDVENVPRYSEDIADFVSTKSVDMSQLNLSGIQGQTQAIMNELKGAMTLHIQMSFHPLTLAEFLHSTSSSAGQRHCFHVRPSLQIMLAILDGIEYLHMEGLVHRDLKPSNIFLSPHKEQRLGSVQLNNCPACPDSQKLTPAYIQIRIGDFGLVTSITHPDAAFPSPLTEAVGTEFYRPPDGRGLPSEKVDVFSLGIILFELLWRFETRMERHVTLGNVVNGNLPSSFSAEIGKDGPQIERCIKGMLSSNDTRRLTCDQVRTTLVDILAVDQEGATPNPSDEANY